MAHKQSYYVLHYLNWQTNRLVLTPHVTNPVGSLSQTRQLINRIGSLCPHIILTWYLITQNQSYYMLSYVSGKLTTSLFLSSGHQPEFNFSWPDEELITQLRQLTLNVYV